MAFTSSFFSGTLDNTNASNLSKVMDRTLDNYNERLKHIESVLGGTSFFQEYFDNYYKVEKNKDDALSIDDNICQLLENYASYLLNSYDVEKEEKTKYKFYYNERDFQRALRKEVNYDSGATDEVIDFLLDNQDNFKKAKEQKIYKKDLNREDFLGETLRNYDSYIKVLDNTDIPLFKKNKIKGEVQRDMIESKDKLLGVHGYKLKYFSESTEPDLNMIDLSNKNHLKGYTLGNEVSKDNRFVKGLLNFNFNGDFQNDFQCILYDLSVLIDKTNMTKNERKIINMYRDGMKLVDIAHELSYSKQYVSKTLDVATDKVCKMARELNYKMY